MVTIRITSIPHYLKMFFGVMILVANYIDVAGQLPMKVARTVSFNTNEGTNIDIDVSPDGKTLAFTMVGEIFVMPSKGGVARQLTRGIALNSRPIWSPDGTKIGFTSDRSGVPKIYVMDLNGKILPFARAGNIDWVHDEICWTTKGDSVAKFAPSRDFKKVMFGLTKCSESEDWRAGFFNGRLSANGRWLVYLRGFPKTRSTRMDSLMVFDRKENSTRLLMRLDIKSATYLFDQRYCFSPDQRSLYIAYGGKIHKIGLERVGSEVVPFDAEVKVDMAKLNRNSYPVSLDAFDVKYMRDIQLRPDGKQLVFAALNGIYVQDLPDGKPRILCAQPFGQSSPRYSPDGKYIAYVSRENGLNGQLWYISASGGLPQQLTMAETNYQKPAWSPNGRHVAILKVGILDAVVQLIDIQDRSVRDLVKNVPAENTLGFQKDAMKINFTAAGKDAFYLASNSLDNLETRLTEENKSPFSFGNELRKVQRSPVSNHILYNKLEDLYLVIAGSEGQADTLVRFSRMGMDPHWEDGGRAIAWNYGNIYYKIGLKKLVVAAKKSITALNQNFIDVYVKPDRTIEIELKQEQQYAKDLVALTNARIITMDHGKVFDNATVLVGNGRIISVGNVKVPKEAKRIDLKGKILMPGLVDLHEHLNGELKRSEIFPIQHWQYQVALAYGTTTSRNPAANYAAFGHQEMLKAGKWDGPRLHHSGWAVEPRWYELVSQAEGDSVVKSRALMGGISIKQYTLEKRIERQRLALASATYGLNMTNEDDGMLIEAIGMLKDGSSGVEHMKYPEHFYSDVREVFARSGTVWTPTFMAGNFVAMDIMKSHFAYKYPISNQDTSIGPRLLMQNHSEKLNSLIARYERKMAEVPFFFESFREAAEIFPSIMKAGGLIGVGGHGEVPGMGMHYEMWAMKMTGMSNAQILEAATLIGAKALGLERDLGSIENGKIADLLILDENPLDDIHNTNTIRYIMKGGILYDQKTLKKVTN